LKLAFEYQGKQHFKHTDFLTSNTQNRDEEKKIACNAFGITLIPIPYWWNMSKSSLIATIHKFRPELIKDTGAANPIPEILPISTKREYCISDASIDTQAFSDYILTFGNAGGVAPKCYSCKRDLNNRRQLRVQVQAALSPKASRLNKVNLCLVCVQEALTSDKFKFNSELTLYPPFSGKIKIPNTVLDSIQDLPAFERVEWVVECK